MKKIMIPALGVAALLTACGDETTVVNQTGIAKLNVGETLDECDASNDGDMVFVTDSAAVYICSNEKWISLNGKDGENGKDGKDGEDGKDGVATVGADGKSCVATDTVSSEGVVGYNLNCGDDRIGTIWSGKDGSNGSDGTPGESIKGDDGKSCTLVDDGDGSISLVCGDGETAESTTVYKAVCGTTPYDPANKSCLDSKYLCDETVEGSLGFAANGGAFTCRSKKWDVATEMEVVIGKGCVPKYENERVLHGYSSWICDLEKSNWVYDFDHILYGEIEYSGRKYKTVGIGTQMWFAENLNYTDSAKTPNLKGGTWCYNNDKKNCETYGALYNWTAAMDVDSKYLTETIVPILRENHRGICPEGWHIPDTTEFEVLRNFVNKNNGGEGSGISLKSTSEWVAKNGSDRFGFNALPTGGRTTGFVSYGKYAHFVTVDEWESDLSQTKVYAVNYDADELYRAPMERNKSNGHGLRCLKND